MNKSNYITILGWMIKDLKLTGKELLAYALIYGFSQDGNSVFSGSSSYVAEWIGTKDNSNARKILKSLCDKGLIEKIDKVVNGVSLADYRVIYPTGVKNTRGSGENYPGGGVKITHHNIDIDNIEDIKKENTTNVVLKEKKRFNFKSGLIDMGIDPQVASDWLQVRKNKRASNTQTAFTRLKSEIEKICAARGMTPTEVVSIAVERSWQDIKAEWIDNVTRSAQASLATTQSKVSVKTTEKDWLNGWIDEQ